MSRRSLPRVAIIIDDIGYDTDIVGKFLRLDTRICFSLFPVSPYRDAIVRKIKEKGCEIMLHLPMEPVEYPAVRPGPGALLSTMTPEQLSRQLDQNLDAIRGIRGVNNHMGSRITQIAPLMYQVLSALKQRNLFFIDSYTTPESICRSSARLLQIPFAQRDVFLDHIQEPAVIRRQIRRLIRVAEQYGEAIGIGHPHHVTYKVLREMLPELKQKVQLVQASQIVHTSG
ncbi:hypothetical protein DENIS_4193 [Desulfonema ishimotonii]|uniref:Divergent polysaccharide deacetylase family protein n=1 Tax=Desulfonema ishimotonii TaxID=45657 RepID=A0A401G1U9_9BACT|nr:divergent polysaccharide deacetylase family protein [Desulfonema ishimotonii]GBC63200.1 hypothetical protein DENIS_4193 [Desulfonema ishimotonii]